MRKENKNQHDVLETLIAKFPETPSLTLARKAFKDNPLLWNSVDTCRSAIRKLRGRSGEHNRKYNQTKFSAPSFGGTNPFAEMPEPLETLDFKPFIVEGVGRRGVLCDVHIPFHDMAAVKSSLKFCKDRDCDTIILDGDTLDFYAVSFWATDPRIRNFIKERDLGIQFLRHVRGMFPKARIIFKHGNHEDRLERYLMVKAPEIFGLECLELSNLYDFEDLGIEVVKDNRPIKVGKLNVLHGHEYKFAIANPVNPARGLFLRAKAHALCGHFHRGSKHEENTVNSDTLACWSVGCLCDLHPKYCPLNNWAHGVACVEVDKDGSFNVHAPFMKDGRLY